MVRSPEDAIAGVDDARAVAALARRRGRVDMTRPRYRIPRLVPHAETLATIARLAATLDQATVALEGLTTAVADAAAALAQLEPWLRRSTRSREV